MEMKRIEAGPVQSEHDVSDHWGIDHFYLLPGHLHLHQGGHLYIHAAGYLLRSRSRSLSFESLPGQPEDLRLIYRGSFSFGWA